MAVDERRVFVINYCSSAVAACVAESVTFPLDITKTRLQIQGEAASMTTTRHTPYRGMLRTAFGIVREEGLVKLWQGLTPALIRQIVYSGARMAAYEKIRDLLGKTDDGVFPFWKALIASLSAGVIGQFIASPTDLVKVHLQMEGKRILDGKPPRYKGTVHAVSLIVQQHGVTGLWKGWLPNVQRAALVNMGDIATYEVSKQFILAKTGLKDNWITHTMASVCAGFVASVVSTPADVIKTRIMNDPSLYKGSVDCLVRAVRDEGFFSLYKGFIPTWARLAPWVLTFWLAYERIKKIAGAEGF